MCQQIRAQWRGQGWGVTSQPTKTAPAPSTQVTAATRASYTLVNQPVTALVFPSSGQSVAKTYRDQFLELIQRCDLQPWPKLWHTLRASRETDLKEAMPGREHVVCEWIGNSIEVSRKHYDRVADKHYEQAISL